MSWYGCLPEVKVPRLCFSSFALVFEGCTLENVLFSSYVKCYMPKNRQNGGMIPIKEENKVSFLFFKNKQNDANHPHIDFK